MLFHKINHWEKRQKADAAVFPCWEGGNNRAKPADLFPTEWKKKFTVPLELGDLKGSIGQHVSLYISKQPEPRGVLWGWGKEKECDEETMRRAGSALAKFCQCNKWKKITLYLPNLSPDLARALAEGISLTNYGFTEYKKKPKKECTLLQKVSCCGIKHESFHAMQEAETLSRSVSFVRDLVNRNANEVTPHTLVTHAKELAKEHSSIKCQTFDRKRIEKEEMGLFLAVAQSSSVEPAFIILTYHGNPKSKDLTALIGKGVTYDTGGLNLKTGTGMTTMKSDMAGSATVLGVIRAAAELGLKKNLAVVIAATENTIDANSYKPGDIFTAYNGTSVEIGNTDAEGRLTLADALSYTAKNLKPTRMISLATLTGAIVVALGEEASGLMSNDDRLAQGIEEAGQATYERVWRLPLYKEYKEQLKSDFADLNNIGGRAAGSIVAASFLEEFVDKTPWAHLDIAGTAFLSKARRYHPKNGTGIGVRLMINFLKHLDS